MKVPTLADWLAHALLHPAGFRGRDDGWGGQRHWSAPCNPWGFLLELGGPEAWGMQPGECPSREKEHQCSPGPVRTRKQSQEPQGASLWVVSDPGWVGSCSGVKKNLKVLAVTEPAQRDVSDREELGLWPSFWGRTGPRTTALSLWNGRSSELTVMHNSPHVTPPRIFPTAGLRVPAGVGFCRAWEPTSQLITAVDWWHPVCAQS